MALSSQMLRQCSSRPCMSHVDLIFNTTRVSTQIFAQDMFSCTCLHSVGLPDDPEGHTCSVGGVDCYCSSQAELERHTGCFSCTDQTCSAPEDGRILTAETSTTKFNSRITHSAAGVLAGVLTAKMPAAQDSFQDFERQAPR